MTRFSKWLFTLLKYASPLLVVALPCVMAVGVFAGGLGQKFLAPISANFLLAQMTSGAQH